MKANQKDARRALLMGYYGHGNLGDELMLHGIRAWLSQQGVELTVLSENPEAARRAYQLPSVQNVPLMFEWAWKDSWLRGKALRLICQFRSHDALLVGGGDLIRDDRGWRTFFFSVEKIVLALLMRKPVFLLNLGIGDPKTSYGRLVLAWCLKRCDMIVVRDERSYRLCRALAESSVIRYAPDIVATLPELVDSELAPRLVGRRAYIALCLRTDVDVFGRYSWTEDRVRNMAAAIEHLANSHDLDIDFIPCQSKPGSDDNDIHRQIARHIRAKRRITIHRPPRDAKSAVEAIGGAAIVIAMRLHAGILAVASRTRCVLLPYDEKISQFARQMEVNFVIEPNVMDDVAEIVKILEASMHAPPSHGNPNTPHSWADLRLTNVFANVAEAGVG